MKDISPKEARCPFSLDDQEGASSSYRVTSKFAKMSNIINTSTYEDDEHNLSLLLITHSNKYTPGFEKFWLAEYAGGWASV